MRRKRKAKKKNFGARPSAYKKPKLIGHGKLSLVMGMASSTA